MSPFTQGSHLSGDAFSSRQMQKPKDLKPFNTSKIKVLLLEDINQTAIDAFQEEGYQVNIFIIHFYY